MPELPSSSRELTVEEKIGVLLASLDRGVAIGIMQELEVDVMIRVAKAMRNLGVVSGRARDSALQECIEGIENLGGVVNSNAETTHDLLSGTLGEQQATALIGSAKEDTREAFQDLVDLSAEQIAALLNREQPGVIALVLRYAPSQLAAEVLNLLPSEIRRAVIVFMCTAQPPSEETVSRVEKLISEKVSANRKTKKKLVEVDSIDLVANIVQHVPRTVEEDLMEAVQEKSESIATEIRDRLFTFEDLVKLSDNDMRRLMQELDMGVLAMALRNAKEELKDKFFSNMSKRAAEGLKEEMQFAQKIKLSDIEVRQREITNTVRTLVADGEISISGEDEYV